MEPNDLPIVCLPLELSGDAAEKLIDFLYQLTEALERHYSGLLINRGISWRWSARRRALRRVPLPP